MSALFLPRELFQTTSAGPTSHRPETPTLASRRGTAQFTSGADVAADLMAAMNAVEPPFVERRRKPRAGKAFDTTR